MWRRGANKPFRRITGEGKWRGSDVWPERSGPGHPEEQPTYRGDLLGIDTTPAWLIVLPATANVDLLQQRSKTPTSPLPLKHLAVGNTYAQPHMHQSNYSLFPFFFWGPIRERLIKFDLALCMLDSCTLVEKLKSGYKYMSSIYAEERILSATTWRTSSY